MQDEIKPYLNDCIAAVTLFISGADYKKGTRYWALNALGSIVLCAEKKILPFQEDLLKLIFNIIQSEQMEQEVKGQALSCAGHIAASCGKDQFPKEALEVFTKFGMECLCGEKKKYELRETALSYFSEISKILKNDMAPIFDKVLEQIFATCVSEEGIQSTTEKKDKFSLDSDSDEEEIVGIDVNTNFIDEKSSAIHCLGNMSMNCIDLMLPHMDKVLHELKEMSTYFHENIRYHVCLTYTQIAFGLLRHYTGQDKLNWKKGLPVMVPLPDKVMEFLRQVVFPHFFKIFQDESNKEVIEKTLECVRDLADELGPGAVAEFVEGIMNTLIELLDKKAFCQMGGKDAVAAMAEDDDDEDEEEDEDEDDEDLDHDEIILGNVTDVIISLSKAFGDSFAEALAKLGPKMVPYLSDDHPKSDRLMVIGCFAEVFNNCPSALPVYFNDYMAIILNNSKTNDSGLNRNCAYSLGVLAEKNVELFKPKAKEAAQAVHMMYQNSDEDAAKDNCIAALCRILANQHA